MVNKFLDKKERKFSLHVPGWFEKLAGLFNAGSGHVFILHGNIGDLHNFAGEYEMLRVGMSKVFAKREMVIFFNVSEGVSFPTKSMKRMYLSILKSIGVQVDQGFSKDPDVVLPLMERLLLAGLSNGRKIALIIEYGESVFPATYGNLGSKINARVITIDRWGRNKQMAQKGNVVILLANNLADLSSHFLSENPGIKLLEISRPGYEDRKKFITYILLSSGKEVDKMESSINQLAVSSGGLMLIQIEDMYKESRSDHDFFNSSRIMEKKIELINKEYGDIMDVIKPTHNLDAVGGYDYVKKYLKNVANMMRKGVYRRVPMGIILMGPPGTGKTFLVTCFAKECGLLVVKLKTIRAKFVGESERNQERFFRIIKALAPIIVVIDESEQEQSSRDLDGKTSEVDNRLRARNFQFWGDPSIRGKILRIDITNWPQLIDPAMRRAGRSDVKIPLLLPGPVERELILKAVVKKYSLKSSKIKWSQLVPLMDGFSAANIEQLVLIAEGFALEDNSKRIQHRHLEKALEDYRIPTIDKDELNHMTYVALQETSRKSLLPPDSDIILKRILKETPSVARD